MSIKSQAEIGKDYWSKQPGLFPDEGSAYHKRFESNDRRDAYVMKVAGYWKAAAIFLAITTLLASGWGIYGTLRPDVITRFVLVDSKEGDYREITANGTITPPDVMMAYQLKEVGRCLFGQSFDPNIIGECENYRKRFLEGNAETRWKAWVKQANEIASLRTVTLINPKQTKGDTTWEARYEIEDWDGPTFVRKYVLNTTIGFEYRQPKLGFIFGDESGLFITSLTLIEEK